MTLLPCPFCGATAEKSKESDWNDGLNHLITAYSVTCTNSECSANVFGFREESEVIAAWNRRADRDALKQAVELIDEVLVSEPLLALGELPAMRDALSILANEGASHE